MRLGHPGVALLEIVRGLGGLGSGGMKRRGNNGDYIYVSKDKC